MTVTDAAFPTPEPTPPPPAEFIDWATFWARDRREAEWVFPDVLAHGRGHALYASHKAGKSLLMLHVAATLATGPLPYVVCYFDYEMGEDDLYERLDEMGFGPDTDLDRLRYALLPSLPPLDTDAGAVAVTNLLDDVQRQWPDHHLVVIFDTTARAVAGEENSADTFRNFYTHTGIELKRRGITWARLDHAGKDPTRGQRGSSSKGDDVDVVWKLTRTENGMTLRRDVARMSWVPERVAFAVTEDPLTFRRIAGDWPAGTEDTAAMLDRLAVPIDATTRAAATTLRDAGDGRRREVVAAALKWRRETGTTPGTTFRETTGTTTGTTPENGSTTPRNHPRNHREPPPAARREPPVPPYGVPVPEPTPEPGSMWAKAAREREHPDEHSCAVDLLQRELGATVIEGDAA